MKAVRKKEFLSWQKYEFDHTFMFQGILLLVSSAASCGAYSLVVYLMLNYGDYVFDSYIANGDIVTSITGPIFWSAVSAACVLFALFLFADVMRIAFRRWMTPDDDDARIAVGLSVGKIIVRTRGLVIRQWIFYSFVYVFWLYSAVVFSFVFVNELLRYATIFVSLTFLTYFGKKLLCYPVYKLMKRGEDKEKVRRSERFLQLKTNEGSINADITSKTVTESETPELYRIMIGCAKDCRIRILEAKIIMGDKVILYRSYGNCYKISLGISAISILTEEELSAKIKYEIMRQKNRCLDSINRFLTFNRAVVFASSAWNPLERVYKPFQTYIAGEMKLMRCYLFSAENNLAAEYGRTFGAKTEMRSVEANLKLRVYETHMFVSGSGFHKAMYEGDSPTEDYHSSLISEYRKYVAKRETKIFENLSSQEEKVPEILPYGNQLIRNYIAKKQISLTNVPSHSYGREAGKLSRCFDEAFKLCFEINYEVHRERQYLAPRRRITEFERERMHGMDKTDNAILSVINDYLTLNMPKHALSLVGELANEASPTAKALKGYAFLKSENPEGIDLIIEAGEKSPKLMFALSTQADAAIQMLLPTEKIREARKKVKSLLAEYRKTRIHSTALWLQDDITGEYRLTSACKKSKLSPENIKRLREEVIDMCRDRLEWAAVISYENKKTARELLVVRCEELTFGRYTDSYINDVYSDNIDLLAKNIRLIGDFTDLCDVSDSYPNAPLEAFEAIEGAVICHKGKLAAEKFLRDEAERQRLELHDGDFDGFEQEESDE